MRRHTIDEVKEKLSKENIILLSKEYLNQKQKLSLCHKTCNTKFEGSLDDYLNKGLICPYCTDKNSNRWTIEILKRKTYEFNNDYEAIDFVDRKKRVKYICKKCNKEHITRICDLFSNKGNCPTCAGLKRNTALEIKIKISEVSNEEYSVIGEYTNNITPIKLIHERCKNRIYIKPKNFLYRGERCSICSRENNLSYLAMEIKNFLDDNKINYEMEYSFSDCKNRNILHFDSDDYLLFLIEADGVQHFKKSYGSADKLNYNIHIDRIKNQYCKKNNIHLLRIPYNKINDVHKILIKTFNDYHKAM